MRCAARTAPPDRPAPVDLINAYTNRGRNVFVDATPLAEGLFASHMAVNVFLLGVAYQARPAAVEGAIHRRGDPAEPRGSRPQPAGVPVGPQILPGRARGGRSARAAPRERGAAAISLRNWNGIRIARTRSGTTNSCRKWKRAGRKSGTPWRAIFTS